MSFVCIIKNCHDSFTSCDQYKVHVRVLHKNKKITVFPCTFGTCRSEFRYFQHLLRHLRGTHDVPKETAQQTDFRSTADCDKSPIQEQLTQEQFSERPGYAENDLNDDNDCNNNDAEKSQETEVIESILFKFLLFMHCKSHLTKSCAREIFDFVKKEILDPLTKMLPPTCDNMSQAIDKSYEKLNSQYKFQKYLESKDLFSGGENIVINYKNDTVFKEGNPVISEVKEKICILPIVKMIHKIFSLPNILKEVLDITMTTSREGTFSNIVDGMRWKKVMSRYDDDSILLPVDLYVDDFEPDNALGSNAGENKICAYYIRFPSFPSHLLSSLKYVFETMLHLSRLKAREMGKCLNDIVEIFKELENGLEIEINGASHRVRFILMRILGDNLGLNEILGFAKGFNATKFCRLCNISRNDSKGTAVLDPNLYRARAEYKEHCQRKDPKATGVHQCCKFNELQNFHCVENFSCDIMHDVYEGTAKYDVAKCLKEMINDKELPNLTLETLNLLKQKFDYGQIVLGNISKPIVESQLKAGCLKMSASEAKNFLDLLPLMIGHLIPHDNKYWSIIMQLRDISQQLMKSSFSNDELTNLHEQIEAYLTSYVRIFGKTMRPKHHFMLHYADCIRQNGPLRYMMTFVFESKNREVKQYALVMNQRVNLSYSLAFKSCMRFNKFLIDHENGFQPLLSHKSATVIEHEDLHQESYYEIVKDRLENREVTIKKCKEVIYKETTYKKGYCVLDNEVDPKQYFKIIEILWLNGQYLIIAEKYGILNYDHHVGHFLCGSSNQELALLMFENLKALPFNVHKTVKGDTYVQIRNV